MSPIILVVADGSRAGVAALRMAQHLAEREGARVEVLAVHDPGALRVVRGDDPATPIKPPSADVAVRRLRESVRQQLQQVGGAAAAWPLTVQVGGAARMIASYAADCGAGRLVLGLADSDPAQRWLARETLLDLIPRLNVPVLAVPPGYTELPRCVVVAVDFSKYSLEIAREALEDLDVGAQLHLVHVTAMSRPGQPRVDPIAAGRRLAELASELELPGMVAVETHLCSGDPADEVLRVADDTRAELVAAGSHGISYPGQVLTGDVYGKLVNVASCPLLIGPPRGMRFPMVRGLDRELVLQTSVA